MAQVVKGAMLTSSIAVCNAVASVAHLVIPGMWVGKHIRTPTSFTTPIPYTTESAPALHAQMLEQCVEVAVHTFPHTPTPIPAAAAGLT